VFPDTMETTRLVLRPVGMADAGEIFRAYGQDAEVTRFLTWRPHRSVAETEAYVTACSRATRERTYAIVGRAAGDVLGAFALRQEVGHRVEFGYVLARRAWGRGLMTEALAGAVEWALRQTAIWRIGGVCDVENLASARVMEKAGLAREGVLRRWIVHPNLSDAPRDCVSYAKVR
jgi:ribosomal-protein-alanine N-acetyltransferase